MTDTNARAAANLVLVAAGVAAAYVIVTKPPLRRLAIQLVRFWLGASVPMYVLNQAREAWADSGRAP
jgi:hypothetical protein